jgi:hypothetical protein
MPIVHKPIPNAPYSRIVTTTMKQLDVLEYVISSCAYAKICIGARNWGPIGVNPETIFYIQSMDGKITFPTCTPSNRTIIFYDVDGDEYNGEKVFVGGCLDKKLQSFLVNGNILSSAVYKGVQFYIGLEGMDLQYKSFKCECCNKHTKEYLLCPDIHNEHVCVKCADYLFDLVN